MFDQFKKKNIKEHEEKYQETKKEFDELANILDITFFKLVEEAGEINHYLKLHYQSLRKIKFIRLSGRSQNSFLATLQEKLDTEIDNSANDYSSTTMKNDTLSGKSKSSIKTKAVIGTSLVAGSVVAAPIVTTGVVSTLFAAATTGTTLASLSGAAATNATLAWLGGGALSIGGGGMAAGQAVLAMTGPIGAAIGLTAFVGGNFLFERKKNQKYIDKLEKEIHILIKGMKAITKLLVKIEKIRSNYQNDLNYLQEKYEIIHHYKKNFLFFTDEQKSILFFHLKNMESIASRTYAKIDIENSTFLSTIGSDNDKIYQPIFEGIQWHFWDEATDPSQETIFWRKILIMGLGIMLIFILGFLMR